MVRFNDATFSGEAHLVIRDDKENQTAKETRLRVHVPLIGYFVDAPPKLANSFHKSEWSRKIEETKTSISWALPSAHHCRAKEITQLPTLGRRIVDGETNWGNDVKFVGEFRYLAGYWEWSEDILGRCGDELRRARIHDAVYASLFTYDRNIEVVKAFCEAWCPMTNTLLTSHGEMSVSLWDLHILFGLPADGTLYDEVIPCATELFGTDRGGKLYLPPSCSHLFHAYHLLGVQNHSVSIDGWIRFWSRKVLKYKPPPARKESKRRARCKSTHNPTGGFATQVEWTTAEKTPFMKLALKEKHWKETYLAAYLACWLCSFVLPDGEVNSIRPETFKMASMMAAQRRVILNVPVLVSIYKGLNAISRSPDLSQVQATFPIHFVYGWMAHYFKTHFPVDPKMLIPKMVLFSGEGGARSYDVSEAQKRIFKGDQISWTCTMFTDKKDISYTDDGKASESEQCFFMAIRSNFLGRRLGDCFAVEPYSPHRFSRQFGYFQLVPGTLIQDIREASLDEGFRFWRICSLKGSMSKACFPSLPLNAKKLVSVEYKKWWDQAYKSFLDEKIMALAPSKLNDDHAVSKETTIEPLHVKRKQIEDPGSTSTNVGNNEDCHWKRKKHIKPSEPAKSNTEDSRRQMDIAIHEALKDVLGSDYSEDSQDDHLSIESNPTIETNHLDEPNIAKQIPQDDAISRFDGKALFENHCRTFLKGVWIDLRAKIMKTPIDFISSLREEVLAGLSLMKNTPHRFDLSCLKKSIDLLFDNAAAYDEARSTSLEPGGSSTQRSKEVKDYLCDVRIKEGDEAAQIESIKKEIAELDERRKNLSMSLKEHTASRMTFRNKIKDFEEELAKINSAFDEEACKKLKSSRSLLELAQKALEDQNPFA